jgi:protein TonB
MKWILLLGFFMMELTGSGQDTVRTSDGKTFVTKVEIGSNFPGGDNAWQKYLDKHLRYPSNALVDQIEGTVTVLFDIDSAGNVYNVRATAGPEEGGLRAEAVRLVESSGKWEPAQQNGRRVRSRNRRFIVFKLN